MSEEATPIPSNPTIKVSDTSGKKEENIQHEKKKIPSNSDGQATSNQNNNDKKNKQPTQNQQQNQKQHQKQNQQNQKKQQNPNQQQNQNQQQNPETNPQERNNQNSQNKKPQQNAQQNQKQNQQNQGKLGANELKLPPLDAQGSPKDGQSPKRQEGPGDAGGESSRRRQPKTKQHASANVQFDNPQKRKQAFRKQVVEMKLSVKQCQIFSHLPQYERPSSLSLATRSEIHPAIVSLGLKYANKQIQGSTARTISMIDAFLIVIQEYQISPEKKFSIDLDAKMKPLIQFLYDCKPISVGMGKVIKDFKRFIMYASSNPKSPLELKEEIVNHLKKFRKSIYSAAESIEAYGVEKIAHGDVILIYGASHLVQRILERAHRDGKRFVVIVVDSSPKFEGRTTLKRLAESGIKCHYILLTAVSYSIRKVTKVLFGAHSLLGNGAVVSRTGTAVVAMMAHANNIPVLVACETFKFQERAQLDSICWNAIENPNDILEGPRKGLEGWKDIEKLVLLNLAYDVTPMDHISVVVSEVGLIPPTSVPVVIRESNQKGDVFGNISTED